MQHTLTTSTGASSLIHTCVDPKPSCALQALQEDAWGPRRDFHSPDRQRRIAVQEGATALICTLLPAIEPLTYVTIRPRDRRPLGQTVVRTNTQRERTMLYTQRYLKEQLLTVLAGENSAQLLGCRCLMARLPCQAVFRCVLVRAATVQLGRAICASGCSRTHRQPTACTARNVVSMIVSKRCYTLQAATFRDAVQAP